MFKKPLFKSTINLLLNKNYNSKTININKSIIRTVTFSTEHDELRKTCNRIIEKDINPFVNEWEAKGMYPAHEVFKKLANAGLFGITRDPEYNGHGLDYSYSVAFFEELANINCGGITTSIMVHTDMSLPALVNFGSDELKREFLAPSLSGDYVACVGVSEPSGGSDVAALRSYARRDGDDLIINGSKMWITNGAQADFMTMLVNTSHGPVHRNKSLVIVPLKSPGVTVARKIDKIGLRSSDTAEIFFDNVRVPYRYIIGEEGQGFMYQMMQFQDERLCASINAVSMMFRVIQETIDYCRQRMTFDQPLINNQYIHFRLAELQSDVECLKSLNYRAADEMMNGENVTYLASIAKLKAGRLSREVIDSCLQYFGGMGFTEDLLVGRAYRDNRALSIAGGTDEIMLGIISNLMGILPKKPRKADEKLANKS
ncbi:putative acyl-CoA dehydrogenase 6 [Dermatophagoides pteronyssinus]|uniref:putative acyl-CoA dehydrogenase 6 n=1 Tax=Dermatophagoides pteronyssinus TaxID=6956 RepID=UPI003F66A523